MVCTSNWGSWNGHWTILRILIKQLWFWRNVVGRKFEFSSVSNYSIAVLFITRTVSGCLWGPMRWGSTFKSYIHCIWWQTLFACMTWLAANNRVQAAHEADIACNVGNVHCSHCCIPHLQTFMAPAWLEFLLPPDNRVPRMKLLICQSFSPLEWHFSRASEKKHMDSNSIAALHRGIGFSKTMTGWHKRLVPWQ